MGREHLGHQRRIGGIGHRLYRQAQCDGRHDQPVIAGVHHRKSDKAPEPGEHRSDQIHRFTSHQVRQVTHQRDHEKVQQVRAEHQKQNLGGVLVHHQLEVGDREGHDGVVQNVFCKPRTDTHQHGAPVVTQHFNHPEFLLFVLGLTGLGFLEDGRIVDAGTNPVADQHHHRREPEGYTPAPGEELLLRKRGRQQQQRHGSHQVAGGNSGLRPTGPKAPAVIRAVL